MTTITINNPKIEEKYSKEELKNLILNFLESKLEDEAIELFQISVDDLSPEWKKAYDNRHNLNYVNL